jgi:hypothetical protein
MFVLLQAVGATCSRLVAVPQQARARVTPPERAFERMVERRERKRRAEKVATAAVALVLAIAAVGGTVAVLSGLACDPVQPASGGVSPQVEPSADVAPIQARIEGAGYDWDEVCANAGGIFPTPGPGRVRTIPAC